MNTVPQRQQPRWKQAAGETGHGFTARTPPHTPPLGTLLATLPLGSPASSEEGFYDARATCTSLSFSVDTRKRDSEGDLSLSPFKHVQEQHHNSAVRSRVVVRRSPLDSHYTQIEEDRTRRIQGSGHLPAGCGRSAVSAMLHD